MKTSAKLVIGIGIALLIGVAATLSYQKAYDANGFFRNAIDSYMRPPWSYTKVLAIVSAAVMAPALLLGILEWRADRAYRREVKALRETDLMGDLVEYEGPEGSGVLLLGAHGRRLLLRPTAGVGSPRLIELPTSAEPPVGAAPGGT